MFRKYLFHLYWFLLIYIVAAFTWWFVYLIKMHHHELYLQHQLLAVAHKSGVAEVSIATQQRALADSHLTFQKQIYGEYITLLLLILLGAFWVYRLLKKEFYVYTQEQSLLMGMTHELKTPIAILLLNLKTLARKDCSTDVKNELIQASIDEVRRLDFCYDNIMTCTSLESGTNNTYLEIFSLKELCYEVLEKARARYPNVHFDLVVQVASEALYRGDKRLLGLALHNLK